MTAVLEVEQLGRRFGGLAAVDDVSFRLEEGTVLGVIIMVAVVLLPMGLVSFTRESWAQRRITMLDTVRAYRL